MLSLQIAFCLPSATDLLGITIKFLTTCQTNVPTLVRLKTEMSRDVTPCRWFYKIRITLHYISEASNLENHIYSGAIWLICIIKTCMYFEYTLSHTHIHPYTTHTHTHTHTHIYIYMGHAITQLIDALHYKPEGCGLDSRWCH